MAEPAFLLADPHIRSRSASLIARCLTPLGAIREIPDMVDRDNDVQQLIVVPVVVVVRPLSPDTKRQFGYLVAPSMEGDG